MQIDKEWMARNFAHFNELYFGGKLEPPKFAVNRARTRLGSLSFKYKRTLSDAGLSGLFGLRTARKGRAEKFDFTIRLSNYYDQTETQFQDVLLHEMIHYYIDVNRFQDDSVHGTMFRSIAARLNKHGHHIVVRTDTRQWNKAGGGTARKERLVLLMETDEPRYYFSVINPRYAERLERQLSRTNKIKSHRWLVTDDSRFEHYSVCRSLRGVRVSADEYHSLANSITLSTAAEMPSGFFPPALAK